MPAKRRREWFDDERFWRALYPFMFSRQRFIDAPVEVGKLLKLAKPKGKEALDLCCGPGRCAVALARRGFHVTGVDRTSYLLAKARAAARSARVKVEWIRQDMRDFVRPRAFHLVLSMFTSFGYFEEKAQDRMVLRNIFASLRPSGVLLMDVMGKERLARILQSAHCDELPDGSRLIQRHEIFDDWTRIRNEWILIRKGHVRTFKFHHTIYSGQELRDRMEEAGFRDVRLYGGLDGSDYGPAAKRLIAVARKPASA